MVFVGTNPYENQSVFFMQYCQGKEIVVIDPRRTATADYADGPEGVIFSRGRSEPTPPFSMHSPAS